MTATPDTAAKPSTRPLLKAGAVAVVLASAVTTATAAIGHASGVSLDVNHAPIPVPGFASLTALFSLLGLALAGVLLRRARHPRHAFVWTTLVLTALSLIPDLSANAAGGTKALLMLTHILAAGIVIPAIAWRLPITA